MCSCSLLCSLAEVPKSTSYTLSIFTSLPPVRSTASSCGANLASYQHFTATTIAKITLAKIHCLAMNVMLNLMNKYLSHGKSCPLVAMTSCFPNVFIFLPALAAFHRMFSVYLLLKTPCLSELISSTPTLQLPSVSW